MPTSHGTPAIASRERAKAIGIPTPPCGPLPRIIPITSPWLLKIGLPSPTGAIVLEAPVLHFGQAAAHPQRVDQDKTV